MPTRKDLQRYITPEYAERWREIGTQLDLTDGALSIIEKNNPRSVEECFNAVLSKWLDKDTNASWKKLFAAINNCTGKCVDKGDFFVHEFN